jgi:adenylate kinase
MTDEESAGVLFMMISPHIITVRRIKKAALIRRRSIRDISRDYFGTESVRFLVVESILFAIMAAMAIWPIVNVVEFIKLYLM